MKCENKAMTVVYEVGDGLYVNLTNRCPCACEFCIRNNSAGAYGSQSLWLEHEPAADEVVTAIESAWTGRHHELVFCGYGEPTERLDVLLEVAKRVKATHPALPIRLNTNGLSDLINGRPTAKLFAGLVDVISVSLNAPTAKEYDAVCHSRFGLAAFPAVLAFAKEVKGNVASVVMTVVGTAGMTEDRIRACREICDGIGVPLRVRTLVDGAERRYRILVINPGSTSTKVSLFDNERKVFERNQFHEAAELLKYRHVNDQMPFRRNVIEGMLKAEGVGLESIDAFVGRGGSAHTQPGGITVIDRRLYDDTVAGVGGSEHPAKLGVMLAWEFAEKFNRPAFTLDPTNVDEYGELARLTGIRGIYRFGHSHVLNQKAVAAFHAAKLRRRYEDCNFIVAHVDGGITVAAHDHGRMVDGNMGADGEGAFTPTRIGSVPVLQLLDYLDTHTVAEVRLKCSRAGGFVDLLGTANADTVHALVDSGDRKATLVWQTMIYQVAKMIGGMSAVLSGKVDAILLTGGFMRFADVIDGIRSRCGFIAPIAVYPGEMEQEALAIPALKVLRGEVTPLRYSGHDVWPGFADIGL